MRPEIIIVVITEWIAFIFWAIHFNKTIETKNKVFILYLSIIAITELINLLFGGAQNDFLNFIVKNIIVPIEFLFLYYYLLWENNKRNQLLVFSFTICYLIFYFIDRSHIIEKSTFFDSLSYGIGCLFVILSVVVKASSFFKTDDILNYKKTSLFWILLGVSIFYFGTFPYFNFRTYLWSNKQYYNLAYTLHYFSQILCAIMYLLFAHASKWITK